jgi:hypothetical protein
MQALLAIFSPTHEGKTDRKAMEAILGRILFDI